MKNLKKILYLSFCSFLVFGAAAENTSAQERPRLVVKTISSMPLNQPPAAKPATTNKVKSLASSTPLNDTSTSTRPTLTNEIAVVRKADQPLVKKTASSMPVNAPSAANRMAYNSAVSSGMLHSIESKMGIPYRYGSSGPNRYDCSGFVWAVFHDAGIDFERMSARSLWAMGLPVSDNEKYKFGTLVFFNNLGHVGIVADENGFYQASSSKGITYSKFEGYWENRIVGFKRLPMTAENSPELKIAVESELSKQNK